MENLSPITAQTKSSPVASLYNKLFSFEGKKQTKAYPIHKKLTFSDEEYSDVYQWLVAENHVPQGATILDAGCGVGFGTQVLAVGNSNQAQSNPSLVNHVTGISLSEDEVNFALENVPEKLKKNVQFHQQSFDNLPQQHWDCIVAVESLKHCENLDRSLNSLLSALKPGGTLLIVEDVLAHNLTHLTDQTSAQLLCNDWHLQVLYTLQDYHNLLTPHHCATIDLTSYVKRTPLAFIKLKTLLFKLLHQINKRNALWTVYRGGFLLDAFYAKNQMRYQLIKVTKAEENL